MKNPLNKRFKREIIEDIGKYLVIFLLLIFSIGFVSGFLVADGSMIQAYDDSFEKYNIEDGNFTIQKKANPATKKAIESYGISVYENFYTQIVLSTGSKLRVFQNRNEINIACVMEGRLPENEYEIAIDRMFADNNHLHVSDHIFSDDEEYTIVGLVALPDYSTMFESNDDTMFDSVTFGVAVVSEEQFSKYRDITYCYGWKYDNPPVDETEEKEMSDDLMKEINHEAALETFIPRYLNQAITFTGEDMGSDKAMMEILLYIIIVIIGFVFAVTASDTIAKESTVIGTLMATGYTKRELVLHYMTLPILVTLIASLAGNILGYTVFKEVCVSMYYGSYSLPTYVTIWNGEAFVKTTIIPIIMVVLITWLILTRKLSLSPLRFLRRDLKKASKRNAVFLPHNLPFMMRFRMRVLLQNIPGYITLAIGILFANILLMFGLLLPTILTDYQNTIQNEMLSEYQYLMRIPQGAFDEERKVNSFMEMLKYMKGVETDNETAEKFSAYTLKTLPEGSYKGENITLYGVQPDSQYIPADIEDGEVYVSYLLADKMGYQPGDTFEMKELYEDQTYSFTITGVLDYEGSLAVFLNQKTLNRMFDYDDDFFAGYFSHTPITDIDDEYIGTIIDLNAMTKVSRQLMVSMGDLMYIVDGFSVVMFIILIYLLSKLIIEKNTQSISMVKILGYSDMEINRLYLLSTTIAVIVLLFTSLPACKEIIEILWRVMIKAEMTGWMLYRVNMSIYIKMIALGLISYGIVAVFELRKIHRIPMEEALKDVG